MAGETEVDNEALIAELDRELAAVNMTGHWSTVPRQRVAPPNRALHWKWDDIYRNLMKAGDVVSLEYSDRRTVQLATPGLNRTSPNTQMSIQLVKAGEVATAHRHAFAATRFIVQGNNAYTTVNGEPLYLSAGDYVTTPSWCWHDHANESEQPIIWLDVHDNPFVSGALNVRFGEQFPTPTQPFTKSQAPPATSQASCGLRAEPETRITRPQAIPGQRCAPPWSARRRMGRSIRATASCWTT